MKILIVVATPMEIAPLLVFLNEKGTKIGEWEWQIAKKNVQILITGIGLTNTALQLGRFLVHRETEFSLVVNVGIAGFFRQKMGEKNVELGDVVEIIAETFGDLGVEERDGSFTHVSDLGLTNQLFLLNSQPFCQGLLPSFVGSSVQKVHGSAASIASFEARMPQIRVETMEGAAFFATMLDVQSRFPDIRFSQIRSISNYVEPRNRAAWKMKEAIENLNIFLKYYFFI
ncbi:MAG: hypothetical protein RL757_3149 [Bacteroidota bacterium]|jgi:futalosine hydrolase